MLEKFDSVFRFFVFRAKRPGNQDKVHARADDFSSMVSLAGNIDSSLSSVINILIL